MVLGRPAGMLHKYPTTASPPALRPRLQVNHFLSCFKTLLRTGTQICTLEPLARCLGCIYVATLERTDGHS